MSITDQYSVIIRFVDGTIINKRVVGIVKYISSKSTHFVELILKMFRDIKLNLKNCIGNSTNGAANMQGEYGGFSAQLS